MSLQFIPLGVGDAFSRKYYSSCLAILSDGGALLVDCPHPIRKLLYEAREAVGDRDVGDFDAVVLTHLHADHVSGVEGYLFFSRFRLGTHGIIAGHREVLDRLWSGHLAAGMDRLKIDGEFRDMSLEEYADTIPFEEEGPTAIGPFHIEYRRTRHHIPTFALKIRADGGCLGYSADTGFDPELIDWLSEADLIIHETNEGIHTPYKKLTALPAALTRKMRLIHFTDDFDTAASEIEPLVQGRLYTVR